MSFGPESPAGLLSPETEYIPFAVCMNFDGTLAGEVFVGEKLTTPKQPFRPLGPKLGCGLITTATNWLYSIPN